MDIASIGPLIIDCGCGATLTVPVLTFTPQQDGDKLAAHVTVDHAYIAAHIATHPDAA